MMNTIKFRITASEDSALMMHNIALANPLSDGTAKLKTLSGIKKKTTDILAQMSDVEFEFGMYYDETIGPFIPGHWLDAAIRKGGALAKIGSKLKQGSWVKEEKIKLEYPGPRDMASLKADRTFRDVRAVAVMQATLMRTRPVFADWSAEFTLCYNPTVLERDEIIKALKAAGELKGVGDFRPECGGRFGRFEVEVID